MTENLQADGVQSRQTLFVWYCLIHVHTLCIVAYTQKISDRAGGVRAGSVYRETLHKLYAAAHRIYYTTFHLELLWFSRNSQKYFPVQEIVWVTVRDACGIAVPEKEAQSMREPEQIASLEKGGGTKCRRDFFRNTLHIKQKISQNPYAFFEWNENLFSLPALSRWILVRCI